MKQYLCIHGHFYQPPRENPWLETVLYQESARPYHDWNERITRECYGPNARSRMHGKEDRIIKLINNYEYMSFNFGPTLLSWLEEKHPWVYAEIVKADKTSRMRYRGHGNAIAQVYNHIIMPLANSRDKLTQIRWGMADFRHRFGRDPEGMWLAETAVDLETLQMMADAGIKFTILSPTQARSIRPLKTAGGKERKAPASRSWQDVSGGRIDPTRPYRVLLGGAGPSFIDIFFYDGPLSRSVAYEKILASGKDLLARIREIFASHKDRTNLVSIATDGESYGHHFKFGEMALSWLFDHIEQDDEIQLTNYGQFLELFPPEEEVKLFENSSWSCSHGVERWRADCGCSVSRKPGWNQKWRAPLREGMNRLSSRLSSIFESRTADLLRDPWAARDDYIQVLLDPAEDRIDDFMGRHSISSNNTQRTEILRLMESQRMALYMFTSCGWFFDDISGIEAMQVLLYACRAIDLVREWSSGDLEKELLGFLIRAESNDPDYQNGGRVYETRVMPLRITPSLAAAHYALASLVGESLFGNGPFQKMIPSLRKIEIEENGTRAVTGDVKMTESRTGRGNQRAYLALRGEGGDFQCVIGSAPEDDAVSWMEEIQRASPGMSGQALVELFSGKMNEISRFTLNDLIPDARKQIINDLANHVDSRVKQSLETLQEPIESLIHILQDTGEPPPPFIRRLFHILFFNELYGLLMSYHEKTEIDLKNLTRLASFCDPSSCVALTKAPMVMSLLSRQMHSFMETKSPVFPDNVIRILTLLRNLNTEPDLWEIQNVFYDLYRDPEFMGVLEPGVRAVFRDLGWALGFSIEEMERTTPRLG